MDPWTVARQAPLYMQSSRQEYWVGSHSFTRESSPPRDRTCVSCIGRWVITIESPGKPPKNPLMRVKEQSEKASLKLNIQKTKIMAPSPITSWQIEGETIEIVTDFIFLGSKITTIGDCSQESKRSLLLGSKAMTNLDSILKSRDVTLATKVRLVKVMVFPIVMYECDSWTI